MPPLPPSWLRHCLSCMLVTSASVYLSVLIEVYNDAMCFHLVGTYIAVNSAFSFTLIFAPSFEAVEILVINAHCSAAL